MGEIQGRFEDWIERGFDVLNFGGFIEAGILAVMANDLQAVVAPYTLPILILIIAILYALRRWRRRNSHSRQQNVTGLLTAVDTAAHTERAFLESPGERTTSHRAASDVSPSQRLFRTTKGKRMSARPNQPIILAENATPQDLLVHGQAHLAAGSIDAAARDFRACVMLATKLKQPHIGATARLELGDLASAAGDMTTACEHWQMAKAAFVDQGRAVELERVEGRMDRAGCPTDWVLNEF
jgi:hypothetical protein